MIQYRIRLHPIRSSTRSPQFSDFIPVFRPVQPERIREGWPRTHLPVLHLLGEDIRKTLNGIRARPGTHYTQMRTVFNPFATQDTIVGQPRNGDRLNRLDVHVQIETPEIPQNLHPRQVGQESVWYPFSPWKPMQTMFPPRIQRNQSLPPRQISLRNRRLSHPDLMRYFRNHRPICPIRPIRPICPIRPTPTPGPPTPQTGPVAPRPASLPACP